MRPTAMPRAVQAPIVSTRLRIMSPQEREEEGRSMPRAKRPTTMRRTTLSRARTVLYMHLATTYAHGGTGRTARRLSSPVSRSLATVMARTCKQVMSTPIVIITGSMYSL